MAGNLFKEGTKNADWANIYCNSIQCNDINSGSLNLNNYDIATTYAPGTTATFNSTTADKGQILINVNGNWRGMGIGGTGIILNDLFVVQINDPAITATSKCLVVPNMDISGLNSAVAVSFANEILVEADCNNGFVDILFINSSADVNITPASVFVFNYLIV